MPLEEGGLSLLFLPVTVSVRLGPDLRVQGLLGHLYLLLFQLSFPGGLGDFRVHRGGADDFLLGLVLNLIGGLRLGLLGVGGDFQLCPLDFQLVLLLGDLGLGFHLGVVGGLVGVCLGDGHVPVRLGLGNGSVLFDEGGVLRTQILNQAVFILDVLDVAGEDLNAQLLHVPRGLLHHLVGEGIPVGVDFLQRQRADDLPHVALEGILQIHGDVIAFLVQKVFRRQPDAVLLWGDAHFGHSVHGYVDEIVGGDGLLRLDVHGHLAQIQLIQPLQKGDADARLPNEDAAVFP